MDTLSGTVVKVETIIWFNRHLWEDREHARKNGFEFESKDILVPKGQHTGGVPAPVYDAFSAGSERACADIVVTTHLPSGKPAVLAIKRGMDKPFGGQWWMQGGSYHTYRLMTDFVLERAEKECGVRPEIQGVIGQFRTCAEDYICSTTNTCFVGYAPYDAIIRARTDKDHSSWCLLQVEDILVSPFFRGMHWYPRFAFLQALSTTVSLEIFKYKMLVKVSEKPELLDTLKDRLENDEIIE